METGALLIESFEISHMGKARGSLLVIGDISATIGYAPIFTWLARARRSSVCWTFNAKILSCAALSPYITADVQRTGVQVLEFGTISRFLRVVHLRPAHSIGKRSRH